MLLPPRVLPHKFSPRSRCRWGNQWVLQENAIEHVNSDEVLMKEVAAHTQGRVAYMGHLVSGGGAGQGRVGERVV